MDDGLYRLVLDLNGVQVRSANAATQWYGLSIHLHLYFTDPRGFQRFRHCPSAISYFQSMHVVSRRPLDLPGLQALRAYPHAIIGRLVASDCPSRLIVGSGPCVFEKTSLSRLYANSPH